MKQHQKTIKVLAFVLYALIGLICCEGIIACSIQHQLNIHKQYYIATEALLDSLEEEFNWIDRYDGQALDNYYDIRSKFNE